MYINIPNILTWGRIALIPVFIGVYYLPDAWVGMAHKNMLATTIFAAAAITDWLDGYLARVLKQASAFGAFLDPVADKLMVAASLVMLVQLNRVDMIVSIIIIGREITISALREWMAREGRSASVAVATIGKLKTAAQMVAIPMLLFDAPVRGVGMAFVGSILIYVAAALTLWSMGYYLHHAMAGLAKNTGPA
ncbi:MAG: CDP-diacylglycerol--glycerol-3-phosphate 3-phosphatidyltransferase [Azoarcus sp.]|jgi:CDP-diacylglycerol--glycerol-3-phosphate 3-phosphatidyltransferase|nr:CDP-diacylglycerol--glycerol-3-phosphate 3-phosphatidyltransferase [Azoarcus sp.]